MSKVSGKPKTKHRSGCPVSISLEIFGDRWSLLIIRDLMVRGFRTFREFEESGEGISTNILADRLRKLEATGIINAEVEEADGRRVNYRLTDKGIDLATVARTGRDSVDTGIGAQRRGLAMGWSAEYAVRAKTLPL